jgi:hypothetical protein
MTKWDLFSASLTNNNPETIMIRAASLACKTLTGRQSPGASRAAPSLLGRMASPFKRKAFAVLPSVILLAFAAGSAQAQETPPTSDQRLRPYSLRLWFVGFGMLGRAISR